MPEHAGPHDSELGAGCKVSVGFRGSHSGIETRAEQCSLTFDPVLLWDKRHPCRSEQNSLLISSMGPSGEEFSTWHCCHWVRRTLCGGAAQGWGCTCSSPGLHQKMPEAPPTGCDSHRMSPDSPVSQETRSPQPSVDDHIAWGREVAESTVGHPSLATYLQQVALPTHLAKSQ